MKTAELEASKAEPTKFIQYSTNAYWGETTTGTKNYLSEITGKVQQGEKSALSLTSLIK